MALIPTPLHTAIAAQDLAEIQRLLSQNTWPLNVIHDGYTPLELAVEKGFVAGAQALLEAGANPKRIPAPQEGEHVLIVALINRDLPMVELLLRHGALLEQPDHTDFRPIQRAIYSNFPGGVRVLCEAGAQLQFDVGNRPDLPTAALQYADDAILHTLLLHKAVHNFESTYAYKILAQAAENGFLKSVRYLVSQGTPLEAGPGTQPLQAAYEQGHLDMVVYLHEQGGRLPDDSYDAQGRAGGEAVWKWKQSLDEQKRLSESTEPALAPARLRF